ncbi:MAG: ferric reductase-like transmembrane domain-containing protein [Pseudomonadota bacterium]
MKSNEEIIPIGPSKRILFATAVAFTVIACIGGALCIPFLYESPTMFYKFGVDKLLLRSAKMIGLAAAILLLLQFPLAGRLKWLDRLFSLPVLYRIHRLNAYMAGGLILCHPLLVLVPEGRWRIPFELRYWPEWVGGALLTAILFQIGLSHWRPHLFNAYHKWRRVHCILGPLSLILLFLHILNVSETFEAAGLPRNLVLGTAIGSLVLWAWIRIGRLRHGKKQFTVVRVQPAGIRGYRVDLEPFRHPHFSYMPGQFAFVSFKTVHISKEFHPFTLASTPSRPGTVQFVIRSCGDWTDHIGSLQEGDQAFIQGPFGRFSHLLLPIDREVVMIAGGIGITPMLSMLRYMTDRGDSRRITLIWSNRTRAHLFGEQELEAMREKLTNFNWVPIFTREAGDNDRLGRLDRGALGKFLLACRRDASIFLCGPLPMISQVQKDLIRIGFAAKWIRTEEFGF